MAIETLAPGRSGSTPEPGPIAASWLGRIDYHEALALQKRLVAARAAGEIGDQLLLLEHPPVLTLGRGADPSHVRASPALLAARRIEVVRVERGGEVTYHGPGQLVAYPIVALAARDLLRPAVRPCARGCADRHLRRATASRPIGATVTRAAGWIRTAATRARSGLSASASSVA